MLSLISLHPFFIVFGAATFHLPRVVDTCEPTCITAAASTTSRRYSVVGWESFLPFKQVSITPAYPANTTTSQSSYVSYTNSTSITSEETIYTTLTITTCPYSSSTSLVSASTAPSTTVPSTSITSAYLSTTASSTLSPTISAALSNEEQVGNSTLGLLDSRALPKWLNGTDGAEYSVAPWGDRTVSNSDAAIGQDVPDTGVTRYYDFTISRGRLSPDGVLRDVILINGQFPGPMIEANWGDWIEVTVHNEIYDPEEGTSLHWHGLLQRGTPWDDGVPGVSQCPIAPGKSYVYRFQAEAYGTTWYHSHYSASYTAGVAGPLVVHGPSSLEYDIDSGPILLSDWYHIPYFSIVMEALSADLNIPVSDNNLINGRNTFNCADPSYDSSAHWLSNSVQSNLTWTCVEDSPLSRFRFQSGKTHRLRLVNQGSNGIQKFSIDGHVMQVIQVDFTPVLPYETSVVTLGVGQRTDVIVTASADPTASFYMRSVIAGDISCGNSSHPLALAEIYYENADTSVTPSSTSTMDTSSIPVNELCANDALTATQPTYSLAPSTPSFTQDLLLTLERNATGSFEFAINNVALHVDYNNPILFLAADGNVSYPDAPQWNVYNFGSNTSVILNVTNLTPLAHPMHLHGHTYFVLSSGLGTWDGTVTNPTNPMRRDTQILQTGGHLALQFELDNPGAWPFHCHIAWHLSTGQGITILERPDELTTVTDEQYDATCTDWWAYTNSIVVDQIDSGE